MINKLGPIAIHKAVKEKIEVLTGLRCYDEVPRNAPSPFYKVELVGIVPDNTKTMWVDMYDVYIHTIAAESGSSIGVYQMIEACEEAMTEAVHLPDGYHLLSQSCTGLQMLNSDETGEKHAVLGFQFRVCYGFKTKK